MQTILSETLGEEGNHNSHRKFLGVLGRDTRLPGLGESVSLESSPSSAEPWLLGDGQEALIEQTLPLKNYILLGASRDIYSQVCLNGRNSWAAAFILQTAPKKIKATTLVEQEKFHCRFSCGTCLSLALMTAFSQVPQVPYKENKTWVCHGMSAKNGIKVTLYKPESLLRQKKILNLSCSFICFHSCLRKGFDPTFILANKVFTSNMFTRNSDTAPLRETALTV